MNVNALITQLKRDEGWRSEPYDDGRGNITIGYGHKGLHDVMLDDDNSISLEYGEQILEKDANYIVNHLQIQAPWVHDIDEARQTALANMAFNLGVMGLLSFKIFIDKMKKKDYNGAVEDLKGTLWHGQVGVRALRIENVIKTGVLDAGSTQEPSYS